MAKLCPICRSPLPGEARECPECSTPVRLGDYLESRLEDLSAQRDRLLSDDLRSHREFLERTYSSFIHDVKLFGSVIVGLLAVTVSALTYFGVQTVAEGAAKTLARETINQQLDSHEIDSQIARILDNRMDVFKDQVLDTPDRLWAIRGHEELFQEFRDLADSIPADGEPHAVYTINAQVYGGTEGLATGWDPEGRWDSWDEFIREEICRDRGIDFHRFTIFPEPRGTEEEKAAQRREIEQRKEFLEGFFDGVETYHQYYATGPQTIEMFLVDDQEAILSFPNRPPESDLLPKINFGVRIRNPELGAELRGFHARVLQQYGERPAWNRPEGG